MQGNLILGLIFALLIAIFSIQNAGSVSLVFFTWEFETSLVVVILGAVALGVIIMGFFASIKQLKLKREIKKLEKNAKSIELEKEKLANEKMELETRIKEQEENKKDSFQDEKEDDIEFP